MFIGYGSEIHLVEAEKRQRKPRSTKYCDAWELLLRFAVHEEICVGTSVRFGEADSSRVIPSQTLIAEMLVEKSLEARWGTP